MHATPHAARRLTRRRGGPFPMHPAFVRVCFLRFCGLWVYAQARVRSLYYTSQNWRARAERGRTRRPPLPESLFSIELSALAGHTNANRIAPFSPRSVAVSSPTCALVALALR